MYKEGDLVVINDKNTFEGPVKARVLAAPENLVPSFSTYYLVLREEHKIVPGKENMVARNPMGDLCVVYVIPDHASITDFLQPDTKE